MTQIRNKQIKFDSALNFTTLKKVTNLANGTATNDAINKSQLDAVEALIAGIEWQDSVVSATVLDPTAETPIAGDRYLINGTGATGFAGHDNEIATYVSGVVTSPASWTFTVPTTGMFVSSDAETTLLYYYGGASWSTKAFEATTASLGVTKVGFDIQLDAASATFIEGAQDAVGTALTNSARVTLTYSDGGNTITADLVVNTINEDYLLGAGTGNSGEILTSDGALGFAWVASSTLSDTEKRTVNASAVTTGDAQLSVTDIFGAFDPRSGSFPMIFINGKAINIAETNATRTTAEGYFGTVVGTAIAVTALAGTENFYFNGVVAGYDLDASDEVEARFTV